MRMDGYDIVPGDVVFDIVYGPGIVHRIDTMQGVFYVRYGQYAAGYLPSGVNDRSRRRTLYWHDPVVFLPAKNAQVWALMLRSFRALWAVLVRSPLLEVLATQPGSPGDTTSGGTPTETETGDGA
jgi:hypothetical protein